MLGFMRDNTEVGYYDVAIKIKVILVNIVTSLGAVLLPRTSYYVEMKMEREFRPMLTEKIISESLRTGLRKKLIFPIRRSTHG